MKIIDYMPFLKEVYYDNDFDNWYCFLGVVFIFSIIIFPLTFILVLIGKIVKRK